MSPELNVDFALKYHCGCRFASTEEQEAFEHVLQTGHTIVVHGEIRREITNVS